MVLNVRSFRVADCDTDHYLVVAKVRERLAVNKLTTHSVRMETFNLKKLNELEGREQCQVEISNRFASLENLAAEVHNINLGNSKREYHNFSHRESRLL
jgi:hypothetical protein